MPYSTITPLCYEDALDMIGGLSNSAHENLNELTYYSGTTPEGIRIVIVMGNVTGSSFLISPADTLTQF